jgi:tRNA (adenine22-N1)-methyltransferase
MKRILNKRLQNISAFIKANDVVLDIGCDHSLLGIYLVLNKNVKVIGSDINKGPLEKAKENLKKYHLSRKIELRLGDGLSVMSDDINTIVISGMGGLSIINILKDIKKYPNVKKLIISPNNDFSLTREEISKLGFHVYKEMMVLDSGKYYLISEYHTGSRKIDNFFGKLDLENETVIKYFKYVYDTNLKILSKLGMKDRLRKKTLKNENNKIKKVLDF